MPKFYVIMKYTFKSKEDAKRWRKDRSARELISECIDEPDNHFPSKRIKMHELQKRETDQCIVYRVVSTNY